MIKSSNANLLLNQVQMDAVRINKGTNVYKLNCQLSDIIFHFLQFCIFCEEANICGSYHKNSFKTNEVITNEIEKAISFEFPFTIHSFI